MKNKHLFIVLAWISVYACLPLCAEVQVYDDSTVHFRYCGSAKRVEVLTDLQFADEDSTRYSDHPRRYKMERRSDGCYHYTSKVVHPETYTYCFRIDGKRVPDLYNRDTVWQMKHKWNIVHVSGNTQADLYGQPVHQGQVIHTQWYSTEEQLFRRTNIYLPYAYKQDSTANFPVLYLLHGINGYEGSWIERGRAIQILENLVAQGRCKSMILVIPDVNVAPKKDKPIHRTLFNNVMHYSALCHDHRIEQAILELIAQVDTTYRVSDERYIAGFSDGARLAANIAKLMPDGFKAVGMFSPVVHKKQLPDNKNNSCPVYYVYAGKKDILFKPNAKRFAKKINKAQVENEYTETVGGHHWHNWRIHLTQFLCNL